jgi:hypothetical protein
MSKNKKNYNYNNKNTKYNNKNIINNQSTIEISKLESILNKNRKTNNNRDETFANPRSDVRKKFQNLADVQQKAKILIEEHDFAMQNNLIEKQVLFSVFFVFFVFLVQCCIFTINFNCFVTFFFHFLFCLFTNYAYIIVLKYIKLKIHTKKKKFSQVD